ncbi:hypothetical protein EDB84DRAFT_1578821 [Lactarius hengduanensis]|nr:hypothetical protein EDB84DRAFT_1578821 [Lactarius hengduanensis]
MRNRRHFSREIKEVALHISHQGMSDADIEEYLGISERSMRRLRATYLATGEVVRIPVCPGRPRLLDGLDSRVRSFHFVATRQVALVAQRSWDAHILLPVVPAPSPSPSPALTDKPNGSTDRLVIDNTQMAALLAFAQPMLHMYLNPVQVPVDIVVPRTDENRASVRARGGDSEEESEVDRKARLRIGALGALQWVLEVDQPTTQIPTNIPPLADRPQWVRCTQPAFPPCSTRYWQRLARAKMLDL